MDYTVTACAVRSKQSRRIAACRFCGALLDEKHRSDLFSTIALEKGLPGRFNRLLQLPVSRDDELSVYCCRKCVGRLNSVEEKAIEEMKSLANSSYSKAGYAPPVNSSPSRERSRKRVKDTSGDTASPHT